MIFVLRKNVLEWQLRVQGVTALGNIKIHTWDKH